MQPSQEPPVAWRELMVRMEVSTATGDATFAALAARYQEPPRVYHTLAHAQQVVGIVDELAVYAQKPDTVRLAGWFHDAVYDPGAQDNEARSATYARQTLAPLGVTPTIRREVARLIRLTRTHRAEEDDGNGQVLADADLAILAAPPATYAVYAAAIRREYGFVGEEQYRRGRLRVLQRLLARPQIYHTPRWRSEREAQARRNLHWEIARLSKGEQLL